MKKVQWMVLCCTGMCFSSSVNTQTQTIYGLNNNQSVDVTSQSNQTYRLQLGAFRHKRNAEKLQSQIATLTDHSVRVVPSSRDKSIYRVVIGPFSSWNELERTKQKIASKKALAQPKKYVSNSSKTHTYYQPTITSKPITSERSCDANGYKTGAYAGFSVGPLILLTGPPAQYIGANGMLSAGYAHIWNRWAYLAGEFFGQNTVRIKRFGSDNAGRTVITGIRSTWSYGFDLLPGIMLNDHNIGYLRGGVINQRFELTTRDSVFGSAGIIKPNPTGWRLGAGIQSSVSKHFDVRAEYVYNQFYRQTEPVWGRPVLNQFNVGVVYRFV